MKFRNKKPEKIPMYVYYIIAGVIIVLLNMLVVPAVQERSVQKTDYSTFIENVEDGNVTKATVEENYIYYEMKDSNSGNMVLCKTVKMDDSDLVNRLLDAGVTMDEVLPESPSILMTLLLSYVVPIVIFIFIGRWLSKKIMSSMGGGPGGAMSFGKSNAKVYVKSSTGIKFSDVAGEDEAKDLLTEIVDYLHNPQKYTEIGASMPKGALLVGPPGTGKTLLAKAVAGEAEVPFFSISGSEFVEMFVGMGAAKVRDLFKQAKKIKIADTVRFDDIAKAAAGASGAELANIVNEAALRAVRDGRKFATQADFEESIEVVIAGYQKKNRVLSNKEKLIVSYHEIGHALVAAKQTESAPVHKITIIPRTSGALGYTMQVDDGEHYLMSKEELENKIATFTGGRAAEELIFHSITTGASNDIEQATKIARAMISRYGMSDDFDMVAMESVSNQYLGGDSSLTCSFETQTMLDKKVVELVRKQHEKALKILQDNIGKLHELAQYLYEHETITGEEFMKILETPTPVVEDTLKTSEDETDNI